jgi:DNA-binding transcriptional ArsR family regulator
MPAAAPLNRYQLAELGALLAEPARAAMLLALMDGSARPAGGLARAADVGAATASAHLKRLLEGGLLGVHVQGRHRYYRLADDEVAAWLESMALPRAPLPQRVVVADPALCRARTCYRHLAGQLGVRPGHSDVVIAQSKKEPDLTAGFFMDIIRTAASLRSRLFP